MSNEMTMASPVRQISGKVAINFFEEGFNSTASGEDSAVEIKSSTKHPLLAKTQSKQIFSNNLKYANKKFTFFDGSTKLDGTSILMHKDSVTGWIGSALSDKNTREFATSQSIEIEFFAQRWLSRMEVKGLNDQEYPEDFDLTFYIISDKGLSSSTKNIRGNQKWEYVFTATDSEYSDIYDKAVTGVKLDIIKWSKGGVLPRITFFTSERIQGFSGSMLKSIEVLEEKTSEINKLSYGITSNYCNVEFLNENKKFYRTEFYDLLRKNRSIVPTIQCGAQIYKLGRFYSDEWRLHDNSMFMGCKAYDILHSLQNITVNIGMEINKNSADGLPISPYRDKPIEWVINELFFKLDDIRKANGLNEKIDHEIYLTKSAGTILPYVLIEEKSAWQILQDIANFCCAYVYADRDGKVIIKEDDFEDYVEKGFSGDEISKMPSINKSNCFSYSLPVTSRTVVNKVVVEYNELVPDTKEEKITIKADDCEINGDTVVARIPISKVYDEIKKITPKGDNIDSFNNVIDCGKNFLTIEFTKNTSIDNEFVFAINETSTTGSYKQEKKQCVEVKEISIKDNGISEFVCKAGLLSTDKATDIPKTISTKILNKYQNGVTYVDAEWKGNAEMLLDNEFTAKSRHDDTRNDINDNTKTVEVYECISNEFKFSDYFRQKTRGRELWEKKT